MDIILAFRGNYPVNNPFGIYDPIAYANYPNGRHPGTDFPVPWGTPLYAGIEGFLTRKIWGNTLRKGNEIVITNGEYERRYGHCSSIVGVDRWVKLGELVGYSGNIGYVSPMPSPARPHDGSHLHDELLISGQYVDLMENLNEGSYMTFEQAQDLAFMCGLMAHMTEKQASDPTWRDYHAKNIVADPKYPAALLRQLQQGDPWATANWKYVHYDANVKAADAAGYERGKSEGGGEYEQVTVYRKIK